MAVQHREGEYGHQDRARGIHATRPLSNAASQSALDIRRCMSMIMTSVYGTGKCELHALPTLTEHADTAIG